MNFCAFSSDHKIKQKTHKKTDILFHRITFLIS